MNLNKELEHILGNTFQNQDITAAYKTWNNLYDVLGKRKIHDEKYESTGIYELSCSNCWKNYIGKTERSSRKYKEHTPSGLKSANPTKINSKFVKYNIQTNHNYCSIEK